MAAVILIVGLGNPGSQYAMTRHNAGFMAVDVLAETYNAGPVQDKFGGQLQTANIDGQKVLLFKPQSFMNLSGLPVRQVMDFYKIPLSHLIVIHDEIDLPPGDVRVKVGGGHAGHNGLKDLDKHLGKDYHRLRIGVGHPGNRDMVSDYVLSPFSRDEMETWLPEILGQIPDHVESIIQKL